ncbi:glycerophosphodiester phosphodiesterase family protein [Agrilactobacillus yilanensis]|uniref:Glycerophosphodiester phosphodiesterase family protein n=2 Tax=Agrilactobacillus yilanensis TaxID=2485997 RepID=A0ABW4JA11_9LACO
MKNKLILRNVIQLLGLWLICLPLSSFLVMQDYFATFRFTEAYLYFIRGSGTIKPVISGLILMYIGIYWLVMHRMGLQRRIHQFPVKMAWVTLKLAFIYIIIAAGVAFIGLLGAKGLWLSLIIMRAVRWTLGLWWWQKLLGKKIYIVAKKQPDIRFLSQCSVLMLALLLWLPQSTVSAKSNAWLAHKGLNGTNGVENSISTLKRTAKAHPDYVEMDVRYTKDQKFIVIHDHKLQRLTGQKGAVEDYTLAQLRRLQARTNGYQARLSSFDAYLTTAQQQHQKLLVELKTVPTQNKNKFVQAFLNRYQDQLKANGALIHSSDPKIVQAVKQQAPAQSVGYIVPFTYWGMPKLAADFYSIEGNSYDLKTANKILKNHKKVYIWTISDPLQLKMNNLKYHNGVISDRFSELKSVMKSFKEKGGYYKMVWVYVSVLNP